jgi:hypothetical protein
VSFSPIKHRLRKLTDNFVLAGAAQFAAEITNSESQRSKAGSLTRHSLRGLGLGDDFFVGR